MKIVIYSSNSNLYKVEDFYIEQYAKCKDNFLNCIKKYTSLEIVLVTELPGMFLLDFYPDEKVEKAKEIQYLILEKSSAEEMAQKIIDLQPDIVIQATFWAESFDWLTLNDSVIGEILKSNGIKTISHSLLSSMICFNKKRMRDFLFENHFNAAKSVYVHHELFRIERSHTEIQKNPYQTAVFNEIKKLNFPVIIKDTFGLSSYGMDVVSTFASAKNILMSKKNSGDRLVEEYIDGIQFGTEIHGKSGQYTVFPPFMFSVNQYGITSPKQSVKIGPVTDERFCLNDLYSMLIKLAEKLELNGIAQVDLVFNKGKWYVLEVNPRLSGMTELIAKSFESSTQGVLVSLALNKKPDTSRMRKVLDIKFPIITSEVQKKLYNTENVLFVRQVHNKKARQHREEGFCEVILGKTDTFLELKTALKNLYNEFSNIFEEDFYKKACKMLDFLQDF